MFLPTDVAAHASERGFILLLPTRYYLIGGTLAVLASALLVGLIRSPLNLRLSGVSATARFKAQDFRIITSVLSCLCLLLLILTGFFGNTDPLDNPLPLTIWTMGWVMLTVTHAVFGNLWSYLNPWTGLLQVLKIPDGILVNTTSESSRNQTAKSCWPAMIIFILFAWFELVSLSPEDPVTLARTVSLYWVGTLVAMILFGERYWLKHGEPFAVFFYFISLLSPFTRVKQSAPSHNNAIKIAWPGSRILDHPALHWSAGIFILITLSAVSFDGVNKTFWWLNLHQINPLAFEGRSSVMVINTRGLLVAMLTLSTAYLLAVWLGWRWAAKPIPLTLPFSQFALAIIPISLGYHLAHYLTQVLVNTQYLIKALADPFDSGLNLGGLADFSVSTSFLSNHHSVELIWKIQLFLIVLGHIVSVFIAHLLALKIYQERAVAGQLPLALLMVLYTLFGLWLLSTPTGL